MASNIITDAFRKSQFDGSSYTAVNLASGTTNGILETSTGDAVSDNNKRAVVWENDTNGPTGTGNEVSGTGYTTRGQALTSVTVTQASHVVTFTSANPVWAASSITAYGIWLVNHQSTGGTSPAMMYFTFGGAFTTTSGTLTVQVNASGWLTISGG